MTTAAQDYSEAVAEIKRLRKENGSLLSELRVAQKRVAELSQGES
jgi:hypothetical protein